MEEITNVDEKKPKLFSLKGIGLATYIGAPLAASILIRKNFIELGEQKKANYTIVIGVLSTILLFMGIYAIPEKIMEKIPNFIIPMVYTGIIYLIAENQQGKKLKEHEENGNQFISNWKSAGIGLICGLVIFIPIIGYVYLDSKNPVYQEYAEEFQKFSQNETASLKFYEHLESKSPNQLREELQNLIIPYWEQNKKIVVKLSQVDGLTPELIQRNEILDKYCDLRIQEFKLLDKYFMPGSSQKRIEIDSKQNEIRLILEKLN